MRKYKGGFSYSCTKEQIKEYKQLSTKAKLDWLEEANRFSFLVMPKRNRIIWEKFRKGEI